MIQSKVNDRHTMGQLLQPLQVFEGLSGFVVWMQCFDASYGHSNWPEVKVTTTATTTCNVLVQHSILQQRFSTSVLGTHCVRWGNCIGVGTSVTLFQSSPTLRPFWKRSLFQPPISVALPTVTHLALLPGSSPSPVQSGSDPPCCPVGIFSSSPGRIPVGKRHRLWVLGAQEVNKIL